MTLELDHVFCMVDPGGGWASRLEAGGWILDVGTAHPGQGTRNRRLLWSHRFLEFLWVEDRGEAAAHPLRLDRRADWRETGASPFGFGLRGRLPEEDLPQFWLYEPPYAPGARLWIHRGNEEDPGQPFLFVMEAGPGGLEAFWPSRRFREATALLAHRHPAAPRALAVGSHSEPLPWLQTLDLPVTQRREPIPRLEIHFPDPGVPSVTLEDLLWLGP
ncbi:MAG TPA: hypothetical protein VFT46_03620 [Holophagaceae bacterium]|nr:hypothetical protein [Holophagaceae bacterium]